MHTTQTTRSKNVRINHSEQTAAAGPDLKAESEPRFRPALFAAYRDLARVRYDYPLVLGWAAGEAVVRPFSELVNEILRAIAPRGAGGEALRCHVLRLEEEIRILVSRGGRIPFSKAWEIAERNLTGATDKDERSSLRTNLAQAKAAFQIDGDLVDCDASATAEVITHLWRGAEARKGQAFFRRIDRLTYRLENMLKADAMGSPEAWEADKVKETMGGAFSEAFDFAALGGAIRTIASKSTLPRKRRQRVTEALSVLKSQQLFRRGDDTFEPFIFKCCADATKDHETRLDQIARVIKAIGVAELELANRYREAVHDEVFSNFGRSKLTADQISKFPASLILLREDPPDIGGILQTLSARLPFKIVLINNEILDGSAFKADLASMAIGLNHTFVLQAASAQLGQTSGMITRGLVADEPAFFSIYSGDARHTGHLSPYLVSAAAAESRAHPSFTYDPTAGETWAERFDLSPEPHPNDRWRVHPFNYEDAFQQNVSQAVAFTPIDFAGCDRRFDDHFDSVSRSAWTDDMIPAADFLDLSSEERLGRRPYILAIDEQNTLWRRVPNEKLLAAALRYARKWRSLQELAGIGNSHAKRLLEQERIKWDEEMEAALQDLRNASAGPAAPSAPEAAVASAGGAAASEAAAEAEAPKSDEPYIETLRCTSCEECLKINNRMFVYNENKQAFIADLDAGGYADLVNAAENCQVSIIHPGKPRNPDEPDLPALLKRAEPFL